MAYDADLLARARELGAATLHEAAGRIGALPSAIKPVNPAWVLAGPAVTVHGPAGDNLWIHRAIYYAPRGAVLVVAPYGGVRDTARLADMGFSVFSNGVSIRGTGKDLDAIAFLDRPVRIGDVVVTPGDLVVGDRDGVVVLPQERVPQVMDRAAAREADEAQKIRRIVAGERTIDMYGWGAGTPP
jgi:4-hydroxy-4-methyl-2-oxoglutarate aldolase